MNSRVLAKQWSYKRYSQYESELRKIATDWFRSKGYDTDDKYSFILKNYDEWTKNIILPEVADFIKLQIKEQDSFPLHKYIHHGLSSQALVFNLVGPLIVNSDLTPLLSLMQKKGIQLNSDKFNAEFEFEDRDVFNEDSGQSTSIDLVLKNDLGKPVIFIESKLVEKEFGGCSVYKLGDCDGRNPKDDLSSCYLHFIGRKYWDKLIEYGFLNSQIGSDSSCVLVNNYQYFRELLFALSNDGIFILLFDERNPTFFNSNGVKVRGLMDYLKTLTPEKYHHRIAHISIQELVKEISLFDNHKWINEFKIKYGLNAI